MTEQARPGKEDRSLGELLGELVQEVTTLMRQEVTLAKAEMSQKAAEVAKHVAFLAAGGAIAYAGLLALLAALIIGLGEAGLPWWLSALIVGAVVAGIGGFLVMRGITALKNADLAPRQTIESLQALKEDMDGSNIIRNRAARPS